jgi:hypothetical protein
MRIIYSTGGMRDWVSVAEIFKLDKGWTPCFWLLSDGMDYIFDIFPKISYAWDFELNRGVNTSAGVNVNKITLDAQLIEKFSHHEHKVFALMNRMDAEGSFCYEDRRVLYYNLLEYWVNIFSKEKPEAVIFNISPHSISEYILYMVSLFYDIKIIMFQTTSVRNLIFSKKGFYSDIGVNNIKYGIHSCSVESDSRVDIKVIKDYLTDIRGLEDKTIPWFMKKPSSNQNYKKIIKKIKVILIGSYNTCINKDRKSNAGFITKKSSILLPYKDTRTNILKEKYLKLRSLYLNHDLKKQYIKSTKTSVDLDGQYIYVPLHYQPERTTLPEGGYYYDQMLMIKVLSSIVPDNCTLYVKENRTQFEHVTRATQHRHKRFYQELQSMSNVITLPLETSTIRLIDNSLAVATVTGTAGWEAVCRGKPVLAFGEPWYLGCSGVFYGKGIGYYKKSLIKICDGIKIQEHDVNKFLLELVKVGVRAYTTKSYSNGSEVSFDENVNALHSKIESILINKN